VTQVTLSTFEALFAGNDKKEGIIVMTMFTRTRRPGRKYRPLRVLTSLALVGSLTLAACGDDDDSSSGGSNDTTADSTAQPTGDPLVVWVVSTVDSAVSSYPNIKAAADIYEKYINDKGGIGGRPLDVTFCDGKADPNEDAACARKAVSAGAIALVGGFDVDVSLLIEVLESENVSWFGACCPVVAKEFSSPIAFNMGAVFSFNVAAAWKMKEDGCNKPGFIIGEGSTYDYFKGQTQAAWEAVGGDPSAPIYIAIPLNTSDYSAIAAKVAAGTDCIHGFMGDIQWLGIIPALKSVGGTQRLYGPQGNLNVKVAESFPVETEGGVVINAYPNIAGPMWDDYRDALERYNAPDLDWNSLAGLGTWAAFEGFRKIVEQMIADGIEVNNNTFIDAANATSNLKMDSMVGDLDFTSPWTGEGGVFPRIFNRSVAFDIISGGKLTPMDDKTYDMTMYHPQ
jgi:ABC-type branched-subunit amino acid transport system substrate-binding protein